MVRPTRPVAGRSTNPRPEGIFVTTPQLLELVTNAQAAGIPSASTHSSFARLCSDYTHLGGTAFKGTETVIEIQFWLRSCERIFSRMALSDLQKVQVASSMLQGRAFDWYELLTFEIAES